MGRSPTAFPRTRPTDNLGRPPMASDPHPNVPYVIRSRRIMLGLSQARLAELVGRTATTVRRWERGEVAPPEDVIDQLAEALEVDAAQLEPRPAPTRSSVVVAGSATPAPPTQAPQPRTDRTAATRPATAPVGRPAAPPRRPAQPAAADTTTDAPTGEPWIQFDAEPAPPPPALSQLPHAPSPAAAPPRPTATATAARPAPPAPPADPDATAAVPAPRRPVARPPVAPARSYLEDPKQRVLYGLRLILAVVALGVMAIIAIWAFGELFGALDEALDFFSETTIVEEGLDLPTLPGAES